MPRKKNSSNSGAASPATAAARIPASDTQRLVRAVELARPGGVSWGRRLQQDGSWARGRERYETVKIGLDMDRERHVELLERRVERFFDEGLVGEVRALLRQGIPPEANAFRAIGYREVLGAILRGDDPDAMRETVRRNTRRLAKRQRTWFRTEPDVVWLDAAKEHAVLVQHVVERWREGIAAFICHARELCTCYTPAGVERRMRWMLIRATYRTIFSTRRARIGPR